MAQNSNGNAEPRLSHGNLDGKEYIVGYTPVDEIMFVDKDAPNADITSVKYSNHEAGDERESDAPIDDQTRMTVLIKGGPWHQEMWLDEGERKEFTLENEGDYIAWEPGYCHTWKAIGNATMLTASFRRR